MQKILTKKQQGFVKDYVKTGNATEAVRRNYDKTTDLSARVIASRTLQKPYIQEEIKEVKETLRGGLENCGIDAEKIAEKIAELLDATDAEGYADYTAIDRGLKHAIRIRGDYAAEKPEVEFKPILVKFINRREDNDDKDVQ